MNEGVLVDLAAELDGAFRTALRRRCRPYDDAVPMLERLAPFYALAVLTNGPGDVQRVKLRASGLQRFFTVTVASGDVGFGKPDPRIFTTALERLGVSANEAIAVGDSLERDVVGAHNAGLRCIWVSREGDALPNPRPDHEISTLEEMPLLVDAIRGEH